MEHLAVYFGNLRCDLTPEMLKHNLLDLVVNYIQVWIDINNIIIKEDGETNSFIARIVFQSNGDTKNVVSKLRTWKSRKNLGYRYSNLLLPNEALRVEHSRNFDKQYLFHDTFSSGKTYYLGQSLGNETRNKEFKKGHGVYIQKELRRDVAKYISAFLNSQENGTLFIGVDDEGRVVGTDIQGQKGEDNCRLIIDHGINSIEPHVIPQIYTVEFIPVTNGPGNSKVIEISVKGKDNDGDKLYSTKDGAFVRRDGSVHQMSPLTIQERIKQKYEHKISRLQEQIDEQQKLLSQGTVTKSETLNKLVEDVAESRQKIKEQKKNLIESKEKIQEQDEKIKQMRELLNTQEEQIKNTENNRKSKNKSRTCSVM